MLGSRANNLDKDERKGFWKWDKDKTLQENVDHLNDVKAKYVTTILHRRRKLKLSISCFDSKTYESILKLIRNLI